MREDILPPHDHQSVGASTWNDTPGIWLPIDMAADSHSMGNLVADIPLEDSFDQYQSLINDPSWSLTGQDVADFAELRRHVLWINP